MHLEIDIVNLKFKIIMNLVREPWVLHFKDELYHTIFLNVVFELLICDLFVANWSYVYLITYFLECQFDPLFIFLENRKARLSILLKILYLLSISKFYLTSRYAQLVIDPMKEQEGFFIGNDKS